MVRKRSFGTVQSAAFLRGLIDGIGMVDAGHRGRVYGAGGVDGAGAGRRDRRCIDVRLPTAPHATISEVSGEIGQRWRRGGGTMGGSVGTHSGEGE